MPEIDVRAILPKNGVSLNLAVFKREVSLFLTKIGVRVKKSFQITVRGYSTPISFKIKTEKEGLSISTDSKVYYYLSLGTKRRWAVMSKDWKSKTSPNSLRVGTGRGRSVILGKRAMLSRRIAPRKGIEARNFHILIAEAENSRFFIDFLKVIKSSISR
jgi:hypothetical protein